MTISGAIRAAKAQGTPYLSRTLPNGRLMLIKMLPDGSFGSCYPNGDCYMETRFNVDDLEDTNWKCIHAPR